MPIQPVSGEIKAQPLNNNFSYLDSKTNNISKGSPAGTYATLAALKAAFPNGNSNIYVVTADGKWYYWSGTDWVSGGAYQEKGLADLSVTNPKIANNAVDRLKISFLQQDFFNLFSAAEYVPGEYYDTAGALIKSGDAGYLDGFGRTPLFSVTPGTRLYRNTKLGRTETGGVFISFFTDESATQFVSGKTWGISSETSSTTVPDGVSYASVAVHNRDLANCAISETELFYTDNKMTVRASQVADTAIQRLSGFLCAGQSSQSWEIKVDYNKSEMIVTGSDMFVNYGNRYAWINSYNKTVPDYAIPFSEMGTGDYHYVFVRAKVNSLEETYRNGFKFLTDAQFKAQSADYLLNWVYVGMINALGKKAVFNAGTRVIEIGGNNGGSENVQVKRLSILGDSISTFAGYIPSGNAVFFPKDFMSKVEDTWWMRLLNNSKGKLELLVNNSWSGSRVTTTTGDEQAGVTRATLLHSDEADPDIIIVYLGINDYNNNVAIGDFVGETGVPTDTTRFSEAYGVMLNNITTRYPLATIYCCTLPFNARGGFPRVNAGGILLDKFNDRIRSISKLFGCHLIELDRLGMNPSSAAVLLGDGLHPTSDGMKYLYEKIAKEVY